MGKIKAIEFHRGYGHNYLQLIIFWMQYSKIYRKRMSKLKQHNYIMAICATTFNQLYNGGNNT